MRDGHRRMVRGGHGLRKVSLRPAMPYPSTPCRWAPPATALRLTAYSLTALRLTAYSLTTLQLYSLTAIAGVACLQDGRPAAVLYPFGHPTPYVYGWVQAGATCIRHHVITFAESRSVWVMGGLGGPVGYL
jgi:hypothetical protein